MKALEWTDKLKATLKPVDFNDMKARALLNLGKVFRIFFSQPAASCAVK